MKQRQGCAFEAQGPNLREFGKLIHQALKEHHKPSGNGGGGEKWFPRGPRLGADLFWSLSPWAWGWTTAAPDY